MVGEKNGGRKKMAEKKYFQKLNVIRTAFLLMPTLKHTHLDYVLAGKQQAHHDSHHNCFPTHTNTQTYNLTLEHFGGNTILGGKR